MPLLPATSLRAAAAAAARFRNFRGAQRRSRVLRCYPVLPGVERTTHTPPTPISDRHRGAQQLPQSCESDSTDSNGRKRVFNLDDLSPLTSISFEANLIKLAEGAEPTFATIVDRDDQFSWTSGHEPLRFRVFFRSTRLSRPRDSLVDAINDRRRSLPTGFSVASTVAILKARNLKRRRGRHRPVVLARA